MNNLLRQKLLSLFSVPLPPLVSSNNVMKLIIKTYLNEILTANQLNESLLKTKLLSLRYENEVLWLNVTNVAASILPIRTVINIV